MPARVRTEEGFGLVELLVALTILSIGIFALVAGFSSGFGAINRASKTSTAGTLADQQMETFRRGGWDSVASIAGATNDGTRRPHVLDRVRGRLEVPRRHDALRDAARPAR